MNPLKEESEVEICVTSGILRVTVHPRRHWFLMLAEVAFLGVAAVPLYRGWSGLSILFRGLLSWGMVSAVIAWFYQLSGAEVIEIDAQTLTIRKDILAWERRSEYPLRDCRDLQWRNQEQNEGDHYALQCKVGWRTVRFGEYVSEEKAIEILTVLQRQLPDVAQKMLSTSERDKKHFTTLGLS